MKKLTILTLSVFAFVGLSACKTVVEDGPRRVIVEDGDHYHGNGKFCPPGHAKKGWC